MTTMSRHAAERRLRIPSGSVHLEGELFLPDSPGGLVVFAHGSGSSRHSPRNRHASAVLTDAGLATLLFDLLTPAEEAEDRRRDHLRFEIPFLAGRLSDALDWVSAAPATKSLGVGLFGASTGAAAALWTAAECPLRVQAVVARGGRPDLARDRLREVVAPTLLIVGERDEPVLEWNRAARDRLSGVSDLHVVPGATHLFPEPGALDRVSQAAADWFLRYLRPTSSH